MKTAYSYSRWSTKSQGETGRDSQTRQIQSAQKWINEHGKGEYVLSDERFIDPGKSGYKGEHLKQKGELKRFLDNAKAGKIAHGSILLIDDYSRLSRIEPFEALDLFNDIIKSGIGIVFTGSYDKRVIDRQLLNNPSTAHVFQQIFYGLVQSHAESAEKSRKVKLAKESLFANIKSGIIRRNNLPKYFTFVPVQSDNIGRYEHNEHTPLIKDIVKMFLEGKSMYGIADILNVKGVKTFTGQPWSGKLVSYILRGNRLLIGEYKGIKGYAPAIIDEQTFNKVQNVLNQNKFNRGKRAIVSNVFKGLCFCSCCGSPMFVTNNRNEDGSLYRYFRCAKSTAGKNNGCENRSVLRVGDIEQEFFFDFIMKNPAQLINENDNKEVKELDKHITTATTKLNTLAKQINDATELVGVLGMDELKVKLGKLMTERDNVRAELDSLNLQRSKIQNASHDFYDLQNLFVPGKKKHHKTHEESMNDKEAMDDVAKRLKAIKDVIDALDDEYVREGVRIMLPSLIGKMTVDTSKGQFFVYNRQGKLIYQSAKHGNERNKSVKWLEAVRAGKGKKAS